jgi:glutaredoxin
MEVILYGNGCPKCRVLETKLKQKGVEFTEISDINTIIEKGYLTVPMLEIDGRILSFTEANTWINEKE